MFEKILANLPYNPSLITDLGFYARRMRQEESIRRLGIVFILLAFFVQFFAVLSPPTPSVAASTNDLINGGFSSKAELITDCTANIKSYRTIINYYGLNCSELADGQTVSLISTSYNKRLFSMGWNPQGQVNPITKKVTDEQPVSIPGLSSPLYWRYLWSWDSGSNSTYQAVKVVSSLTGRVYFILYACGNLVSIGIPSPYIPPTPAPTPTPTPTPTPSPRHVLKRPTPAPTLTPTTTTTTSTPTPTPTTTTTTSTPTPTPTTTTTTSTPTPCQYDSSITASSALCKPCQDSLSSTDTVACIQYSKTASDNTQGLADANGKTANAGDSITYTLTAYNSGKAQVANFVMQDDLSYVLDYATILSDDHGSINSNGIISWPAANISPAASETHTIVINVKNPIPQTPPSSSDPAYFDHVMTNVYGNTININLPSSPVAVVASVTTSLPNTGPGSSLIMAAVVIVIAGYFFARSRLLSLESGIAIAENNGWSL